MAGSARQFMPNVLLWPPYTHFQAAQLVLQRIDISSSRTFQQPTREPLGEDWGKAELRALLTAGPPVAAAIRRALSNEDPATANVRCNAAYVQRAIASLPEGEAKESLRQGLADLRQKAEAALAQAQLPHTEARAGKVARRQAGRPEGQRRVTALHPNRQRSNKRSLAQQLPGEYGEEFKPQVKKGRTSEKVGGLQAGAWSWALAWAMH